MISLTQTMMNQGSGEQWDRDEIYPKYPLTFIISHNLPIIIQWVDISIIIP